MRGHYNSDQHSSDYAELADKPRPSHADYTAWVKWGGQADMRGGGHFSGRLTAPLCIAGGIAKQILARRGVFVGAHLAAVGAEDDEAFPLYPTDELFRAVAAKPFPTISDAAGERMQRLILSAREAGIPPAASWNVPPSDCLPVSAGPMFDGMETALPRRCSASPPSRAWSSGAGFGASRLRGSENNDAFSAWRTAASSRRRTVPAASSAASPPVCRSRCASASSRRRPSADRRKRARSRGWKNTELTIRGRHDPCIAHRAVPVVEAVTACVLLDLLLEEHHGTF